jgi:hypothetical protein
MENYYILSDYFQWYIKYKEIRKSKKKERKVKKNMETK